MSILSLDNINLTRTQIQFDVLSSPLAAGSGCYLVHTQSRDNDGPATIYFVVSFIDEMFDDNCTKC